VNINDQPDFAALGRELGTEAAAQIAAAINGSVPAPVEVPVKWCIVHEDEDYGMDDGKCGMAWAAIAFDHPEPSPCHLVPLFRYPDPTEDTPVSDRRYPLAPLMEALRIQALEPGWCDRHHADQRPPSRHDLADIVGVDVRTVERWAADGIPERHIDRLAVHIAHRMPWELWPDWTDDDPTEDDLASRDCRCRTTDRTPLDNGTCDRCGGTLPNTARAAA